MRDFAREFFAAVFLTAFFAGAFFAAFFATAFFPVFFAGAFFAVPVSFFIVAKVLPLIIEFVAHAMFTLGVAR